MNVKEVRKQMRTISNRKLEIDDQIDVLSTKRKGKLKLLWCQADVDVINKQIDKLIIEYNSLSKTLNQLEIENPSVY